MEDVFRNILRDEVRAVLREEMKAHPSPPPVLQVTKPRSEQLLTVPQIAARTEYDPKTVRSWIETKKLKASRPGAHYRVKESDLERFLEERQNRPQLVGVPDADEEVARILAGVTRRR